MGCELITSLLKCFIFIPFSFIHFVSLVPSGACEHRQRDVFRAARARRLRRVLQPSGGPRPLFRYRLQLLRWDECRDVRSHSEGHLVSSTGAAAAYCVDLQPQRPTESSGSSSPRRKHCFWKHFVQVFLSLVVVMYASLEPLILRELDAVAPRCFWYFFKLFIQQ